VPPARLTVQLESALPPELAVGEGSALFICGWCFAPAASIDTLELVVDGGVQPLMAYGMPRLDPVRALGDPRAYPSGFWGIARIAPGAPGGVIELGLRAALTGGGEAVASLGEVRRIAPPAPVEAVWPAETDGSRVAIAMAAYNPAPDLFERQIASIRAQTHRNWICIVSDDCSGPSGLEVITSVLGDDPRFVLSRSPRRRGFYGNFERALSLVPPSAEFVALADQDDVWHPDKLDALLAGLGDAQLVYSDARVVSRTGEVISPTWWSRRRHNHTDMLSLLVANSVSGSASLLRRGLLDHALPFPPAQFAHFHDHWLGLTALACGGVAFVDRPLYDYVQHGEASLGHEAANRMTPLRERLRRRRPPAERVGLWRLHYFVDVCRLVQFATILTDRCGESLDPAQRRALRTFTTAEPSPAVLARLGLRGVRELTGTPETLGAEWMLFHALVWRRLLSLTAREEPQRHLRLDAVPPPSLVMEPGREGLDPGVQVVADKVAPLRFSASDEAPERINLLVPTIELRHLFGGYIAKFNLALRLAERGLRVRVLTTDPVGPLPADWRATLASYAGLERLTELVEFGFGRESAAIEVSRGDRFVATTWWTAHIARAALRALERDGEPFLYLIQEYEPFTFPMGSYAALAAASYSFPHVALFSTRILRDYFRAHAIGVFARGGPGEQGALTYDNAITSVAPPTVAELAARRSRRLLVYARPEPHAARNMFELGVLALARALEEGVFAAGWELNGIGSVDEGRTVSLTGGRSLRVLARADQASYGRLLASHDVGLALMLTPHPSLVPIEMASAGMVTVTNTFENKDQAALAAISENLIAVEPSLDAIVAGLGSAERAVGDAERRVRGSQVHWSRDWAQTFPAELLDEVLGALARAT
jgi:glycosyltransferase involved in cell wall biosynthesis